MPGEVRRLRVVVRLRHPPSRTDRARLIVEHGLQLVDHVPGVGYVESVDPHRIAALRRDPLVSTVEAFDHAEVTAVGLGGPESAGAPRGRERGEWLEAVLFADVDADAGERILRDHGATDVRLVAVDPAPLIRFRLDPSVPPERIAGLDAVRWLDEVPARVEDGSATAGLLQSGDPARHPFWDAGVHGEGQVVGVLDSSRIDVHHCFFVDADRSSPGPGHRKVLSVRDAAGTHPTAHASFVAGCVAGDDVARPGEHPHRGGAWAARIVSSTTRDIDTAGLLAVLEGAAADGATIHTNSWHSATAGPGRPAVYTRECADVDLFTWRHEDHLVLGSAGNAGEELGPPGTAKNALCIGATRAGPGGPEYGDGNAGPTADGRRKPDALAPGGAVESVRANSHCATRRRDCASSWATPQAAAGAALVRQYLQEGRLLTGSPDPGRGLRPTGALLKALLLNATVSLPGRPGRPDHIQGWGVIRLDRLLGTGGSAALLHVRQFRNASGLCTGESRGHVVVVPSGGSLLIVTLTWTDAPAAPGAAVAAVNDLDLEVDPPDRSVTWLGNQLVDGVSVPGGVPDAVNNVEMVVCERPAPGPWSIRVRATAVHVGRPGQGYALVVTLR